MPNRIIKESICTSDNIDQLSAFQETMFYRLIVNCDDFGRFDGRPKILASKLFPLKDIRTQQIEEALRALTSAELVILYEVDGKPFLQMKTWDRHQQIRAKRSKYPAPVNNSKAPDNTCNQMISDDSKCPRNPIQSESESNPNPITNVDRAREEETPFGTVTIDPLIVKVQREIVGMTDTHYDLFRQYRDDLGDELVSYAIDSAVAQGVRKWAYLETILCKWLMARYRTVAEVKSAEEERKKKQTAPPQKPGKVVTAAQFTQREYSDDQWSGVDGAMAEALKKVMSG